MKALFLVILIALTVVLHISINSAITYFMGPAFFKIGLESTADSPEEYERLLEAPEVRDVLAMYNLLGIIGFIGIVISIILILPTAIGLSRVA